MEFAHGYGPEAQKSSSTTCATDPNQLNTANAGCLPLLLLPVIKWILFLNEDQTYYKMTVYHLAVFRALGIPSRPVTNFVSARDTNHTLSVDKYFDVFGDEMKGGPDGDNQDALWNFHAW